MNYVRSNNDLIKNTNTVMFCVKPKDLSGVLRNVSGSVKDDQLIVSIAAGVQLNKIEKVEFMNFQIVNFCFC